MSDASPLPLPMPVPLSRPGPGARATLARPRVTTLLAVARQRRATLVIAGAGYGKTTALAQIAAAGASAWVRLRPADAQAESLAARLAAALGESPAAERSAIAAATGSDDRQVMAERRAALLCELAEALTDDLLLIIDGLECVGPDKAASHLLRVLALEAPPRLHLVLSGRNLPGTGLARGLGLGGAQGRGEVLEVTARDLRFTAAETAELVGLRLAGAAATVAQECWSLTEGWPAALQLLLDRLERLDQADQVAELGRLRHTRGQLWKAFARELVADEDPVARRVLAAASLVPRVDAALLNGVEVAATADDLESLRERGLLVEAGAPGYYRLSPVLAGAIESAGPDVSGLLREQAARWLEDNARIGEALECHAASAAEVARSFLARRGPDLVRAGGAARVIEVLRDLGTADDPSLDALLAEALQAVGDWDAAIDLFARVERAARADRLPAGVAWRYGWLLYLRGQVGASAAMLAAAYRPGAGSADDAMVSAALSTALWSQGLAGEAGEVAATALDQAGASADSCAVAAAHVSLALAAASRGERERNEQEYRLALAAAKAGGDRVQLARIHANLSSRALENGAYPQAIAEAELALETGAGHRFFTALALTNKAEAHVRLGQLDDARLAAADAAAIYDALGSLHASLPHVIYGEIHRMRGDLVRARGSFERSRALAEQADDVHTLVIALAGLARVLSEEDIVVARATAADAVARSSGLERATALCAAAEVELRAGDKAAAAGLAGEAEAQARATDDLAALAEALEIQGAAKAAGYDGRLTSALAVWTDIGNPVGIARVRLARAILADDDLGAEKARRELGALGVAPAAGVAGLLAAHRGSARRVAIVALGRFAVMLSGEAVPVTAWQSRKARDLLKVLVARSGHPITREAAAEALWPGEYPAAVGNRLSVALSTIRKVLDPDRRHPPDHYLVADARTIALRLDRVDVDLNRFLQLSGEGIDLMAKGEHAAAAAPLRRARQIYAGDFLEEDLYEEWAVEAREEARSRVVMVLRLLARLSAEQGDDESAGAYLGQLLEREPYDEDAWLALIAGQRRLRRHGEARRRYAAYARRMTELDVVPVAFADASSWAP